MSDRAKSFFWYELMTNDLEAAEAFYTSVVGWTAEPFDAPGAPPYLIVKAGNRGVGGLMAFPEEIRDSGMPPAWMGYIEADDVDAVTASVKASGGSVHREPADIPDVGRSARRGLHAAAREWAGTAAGANGRARSHRLARALCR